MLDILKMESWRHMGRTANMIIKDIIHIFASISKSFRMLLIGLRYRQRWLDHDNLMGVEIKYVPKLLDRSI